MSQPHIVPPRVYYTIFAILLLLTLTTVLVSWVDLGRFSVAVALLIAGAKATLVILYFMHVRYSSGLTRIFGAAGLFWLALLIGLTAADYVSRSWIPMPRIW
jgi:cytochrome c oxidase subunit IV